MGKKYITINMAIDEASGFVEELDMTEGLYNRTEYISDGETPISIRHALTAIREDLEWEFK